MKRGRVCDNLLKASKKGNFNDVVRTLAIKGVQVNLQDKYEMTALHWVSDNGRVEDVKLLLVRTDILVNLQDKHGMTALHRASLHDYTGIVEILLARTDIQVNLQDESGMTALHWASHYGCTEAAKLLLAHINIQVNLLNDGERTALYWASVRFNCGVMKLLLAHGAKVSMLNINELHFSDRIKKILKNWKYYLPRWNRFKTCKYYPTEFNRLAFTWLMCCKRLKVFPKDIRYLMLEYIAEAWKFLNKNDL